MISDTGNDPASTADTAPDVVQVPTSEFFTLAGLASAVVGTAKLGQQGYQLLKTNDPLIIQVLDSVTELSIHQIHVRVTNNTVHGIYLEEVSCVEPKNVQMILYPITPTTVGSSFTIPGTSPEPTYILPHRIRPGGTTEFKLHIWPKDPQRLAHDPWGRAEIIFSKLDEKKTAKAEIVFRLRPD